MICDVESLECNAVSNLGSAIGGSLPRWSQDEDRIFFLRRSAEQECCDLWVVNRDGSDSRLLTHLEGFDFNSSYIGVTDQDEVFYSLVDGGDDEIWLVAAE